MVGVHLENTSHTLLLALSGVENGGARFNYAGVNPEKAKLTHKWAGGDLKRQSGERLVISRFPVGLLAGIGVGTLYGGDIEWRGHIVNYRVKQLLNALVLIRSTANYRYYLSV